ncbi:MAG: ParA family protein [Rickettsia endosymbiont of Ixodes persulcatus]|nr:ParA family protein [Rickettsia endosymbiont of Ixodes persulcatus]
MIKVIANATNKGGEGKTTMSIMLAEYVALTLNKKVLAIDLDPQANFSKYYLNLEYDPVYKGGKVPPIHPEYNSDKDINWDGRSSIANIFYGEEVTPYPTDFPNIEILPAHSSKLQEAEAVTRNEVLEKVHLQLKRFIQLPDVQKEYDVIILDTPPSKGPLTIAGIKACTHMVIPSQMEEDSIDGIYGMLQLWKQETYSRSPEHPINIAGILANRVRDVSLHNNFFEQLKSLESTRDFVITKKIKERVIYGELRVKDDRPKSVFELPKNHVARKECETVCKIIMERIYNHG